MFDPSWDEGCRHCSFWADNFNGIDVHLNHRDVTLVAISRAPLAKIEPFRKRMGWSFKWLSSHGTSFNYDYGVSFTPEQIANKTALHNYRVDESAGAEHVGISAFHKDAAGGLFHTYSCYQRGIDLVNGAYNFLDLMPKGRDEKSLPWSQAWVRHHDRYED